MKAACTIALILLNAWCSHAQLQPVTRFVNFGAKDGLVDKYVYTSAQDKKGYMWFGTSSGLCRFDGHNFIYVHSPLDKPGNAIGNILISITEDDKGNFWLGSMSSLQWFNPQTHTFSLPSQNNTVVRQMLRGNGHVIFKGLNGKMWIGTQYNFFFCFNPKDSAFTHFENYPANASKQVFAIYETPDAVYAIHPEGIYTFTPSGKYTGFYRIPKDDIANAAMEKKGKRIILTTNSAGLFFFDLNSKAYDTTFWANNQLSKFSLFSIMEDEAGNYYIGSYPLIYVDNNAKKLSLFDNNIKDEFNLGVSKVCYLFADREKNTWICSHYGLSMKPWQNGQVRQISLTDPISKNTVEPLGLADDDKYIYVTNTSTAGLVYIEKATAKVSAIENTTGKTIEEKRISGIIKTPDGKLFCADEKHIFLLEMPSKKFASVGLVDQNGKPLINVGKNVFDRYGNIYIQSRGNGMYVWQYPSKQVTHFNIWEVDNRETPKSNNRLQPGLCDRNGNIWILANESVFTFNPKEKIFTRVDTSLSNDGILFKDLSGITEDYNGHIWITSLSAGLFEIIGHAKTFTINRYNRQSAIGLNTDYLYSAKTSPVDSSLWISSLNGLIHFDPKKKIVLSYLSKQNGMLQDAAGYGNDILSNSLLVQMNYGVFNFVNLANYKKNNFAPDVQFNSIRVMNKEMLTGNNDSIATLKLNHAQNYLQFEFAALAFNNADRNTYIWKLANVDTAWVQGGNVNHVSYSALKPGKYIFKVKARNCDGVEGPEKTISIIIEPPFYLTWWFIAGGILLATGLFLSWNRFRINQVRREEKIKADFQKQIAEVEMKALRAQMNPHFLFNSLNSIQKFILKNQQEEASAYLTKFSRLIRLILDHSNQHYIPLNSELEQLNLYLEMESMRFDKMFSYKILVDEKLKQQNPEIPSMLIQPFVENAIWHGLLHVPDDSARKLLINFENREKNELNVMIDDNGVGREKSAEIKSKQLVQRSSYGMKITEDRITILNKTENTHARCEIIDKKNNLGAAMGTTVLLSIPLKYLNKPI